MPQLSDKVVKFNIEDKNLEFTVVGETKFGEDEVLLDKEIDLTKNTNFSESGFALVDFLSSTENQHIRDVIKQTIYHFILEDNPQFSVSFEAFKLNHYHLYVNDQQHQYIVKRLRVGIDPELLGFDIQKIEERISQIVKRPVTSKIPSQKKVFVMFRIVRPLTPENNPPHKDSWLAIHKNAINAYFPVAGSSVLSSLPVLPASHRWKESDIERTVQGANTGIHSYVVPAVVACKKEMKMIRPQPATNQIMIFSPYLIHGGAYNFDPQNTRVSLELRFWPV